MLHFEIFRRSILYRLGSIRERIIPNPGRRGEGCIMDESQRYRRYAVDCLRSARKATHPHYRKCFLLMARSWGSLARQEEATDVVLAILNAAALDGASSAAASHLQHFSPIDHSQRPIAGM